MKIKKYIKKYLFFIISSVLLGILFIVNIELGIKAISSVGYGLKEVAIVLPPIFILLGLLDVWVSRKKMTSFMGEGSGVKGIIIAIILGSVKAGPLYAPIPNAAM